MNKRLLDLMADVLELPTAEITPALRRADTATWDSLNHLRLITVLEAEFGTPFTMDEISEVQTPLDLQRIMESRGAISAPA